MLNIIIFGTGKLSGIVISCLKHDKVNIIYYSDNDKNKWGSTYQGKEIIDPSKLANIDYDYIVIASQYNEEIYSQLIHIGVIEEKIFEFCEFFRFTGELYPKDRIEKFIRSEENYECIITGISYSLSGININSLKYKAYTFANGSQDLYYDYKIAKYIIENTNYNLRYCIIGLSYYSFQYDLSLSNMKFRLSGYYEFFKDCHNAVDIQINRSDINTRIGRLIINVTEEKQLVFNKSLEPFEYNNQKEELGKQIAINDSNKNYPKTVEENKVIFENYIELLQKNNIEPIIVVFPTTKYYSKYFDSRLEEQFHSIVNPFKSKYRFKYIDYFRSELFEDKDFSDVSHLNWDGAEKFTQIINQII